MFDVGTRVHIRNTSITGTVTGETVPDGFLFVQSDKGLTIPIHWEALEIV